MSGASSRVVSAFRRLMRAQRTAFAQDHFMQGHARKEIRRNFEAAVPAAALDEKLQQADEAAEFLLTSVIQAKKKENGKFVMNLQERHTVPDPDLKR